MKIGAFQHCLSIEYGGIWYWLC